jgi:hypothetical protein
LLEKFFPTHSPPDIHYTKPVFAPVHTGRKLVSLRLFMRGDKMEGEKSLMNDFREPTFNSCLAALNNICYCAYKNLAKG